jgi:hypothetical protein
MIITFKNTFYYNLLLLHFGIIIDYYMVITYYYITTISLLQIIT